LLSQGQRFAAWQRLQSGLRQSDPEQSPDEWLMMAVCALAIEDHSTAARYAQVAHAKMTGERHLCHWNLLRDTYADWLTVTATIEISQGRLETAAEMLQCAFDSHKAVGDLEQMAVDLMLTADCCRMQGDYSSVRQSLTKASSILREECDADRHLRLPGLLRNLSHRLSEGEVAYAEPFASDA
jgi:predicted metal-dependent hydrolase